ncbi:MAG TPA: cupin domain-containing protein [Polyangiaceae bacterium]|nr:cupin domain-containing protein [Polyangiaceae bacterium]
MMNRIEEWLEGHPNFRRETLGRHLRFFDATERRASSVRALSSSWAIEDVLDASGTIHAWFEWLDGRHRTTVVPRDTALELYRSGTTLYVHSPRFLAALADEVASALGIPRKFIECAVFCNQPGAISRMHFDSADTLTVQISGSKRWTLAPNAHAPEPMASWATRDPMRPTLQLYAQEPFPASMPGDAQKLHLKAGAMLYVPRGTWHETLSEEESVSLHIHLLSYSWLDAALATLRARLVRDQTWRRNAYPLWDPEYEDAWDARTALETLREAVGQISEGDLARISATVSMGDPVVSRARSSFGVDGVDAVEDGCAHVVFTVEEHGIEHVTNMDMSDEYLAAARLIARSGEGISAEGLATQVPALEREDALQLVRLLVDIGYARRA